MSEERTEPYEVPCEHWFDHLGRCVSCGANRKPTDAEKRYRWRRIDWDDEDAG